MSKQQHASLTGWRSIAEVTSALGVLSSTIGGVVARAAAREQDWVTQEVSAGGARRWLINTDSLAYRRHAGRWKRLAAKRKSQTARLNAISELPGLHRDEDLALPIARCGPPLPADYAQHSCAIEALQHFPELCSWLREQGVLIFTNALWAQEQLPAPWQWRWGELTGAGCESIEAAMLAALTAKLAQAAARQATQGAQGSGVRHRRED